MGPEQAGSEDPEGHVGASARHGLNGITGVGRAQKFLKLQDILRELVAAHGVPPEGPEGLLVGTWRPTQPQVDAARIEGFQRAELLGDDQG